MGHDREPHAMPRTQQRPIDFLFVDAHLVVVNKPSGLLVHRGWDDDHDVAMFRVRDAIGARVHAVHRLDRGTSGVLLFARSRDAAASLSIAFARGAVEKRYLALVRGTVPVCGVVDHPVPKTESGARVSALSRFRRVARSPIDRCSLVEVMPETGRFHQIRRHMKHIDHPLIGDVNYGSGEINRHYRARYDLHRLALHAHHIAFAHPHTGARVEITAPMAEDLGAALVALGLPTIAGEGDAR